MVSKLLRNKEELTLILKLRKIIFSESGIMAIKLTPCLWTFIHIHICKQDLHSASRPSFISIVNILTLYILLNKYKQTFRGFSKFQKSKFVRGKFLKIRSSINLPWSHVRSNKNIWPDQFHAPLILK